MSNFKSQLDESLLLVNDGIDLITISNQIDNLHNQDVKSSYNRGWRDGFKSMESLGTILGVIGAMALIVWAGVSIHGCNEDEARKAQFRIDSIEKNKKRISEVLTACSAGDYSECRSGWNEFNTEIYRVQVVPGSKDVTNGVCASFEEAYYNRTSKPLVSDKNYAYFQG